ncbi:hypothetical protein DJ031_04605 [bacterium endosymbiont of Escarpia laminata]|nr:MAG: hypothetical protein DJ031_04605 [bacterium endosymbiont of Escarpia laminata]
MLESLIKIVPVCETSICRMLKMTLIVVVVLAAMWFTHEATAAPQPAAEMAFVYDAVPHESVSVECTDGAQQFMLQQAPLVQRSATGQAFAVAIGSILTAGPGTYDCLVSVWAAGAQSPKATASPLIVDASLMVDIPGQPSIPGPPERVELWRIKVFNDGTFEIIPIPIPDQQSAQ